MSQMPTVVGAASSAVPTVVNDRRNFLRYWVGNLTALDLLYKWMVDGNTAGDGVVPSSSQQSMPNAFSVRRVPGDPDHVIAPSSREAHFEVENLLRSQFGANILPIP